MAASPSDERDAAPRPPRFLCVNRARDVQFKKRSSHVGVVCLACVSDALSRQSDARVRVRCGCRQRHLLMCGITEATRSERKETV